MPVIRLKIYAINALLYAKTNLGHKKTRLKRVLRAFAGRSGHEHGDESQQEDQQAAHHGDHDRNVFDHGLCRIDGVLFVVGRHGVSPNSNMGRIVAKTNTGWIEVRKHAELSHKTRAMPASLLDALPLLQKNPLQVGGARLWSATSRFVMAWQESGMVRRIAQESRTGQVMLPPGLAAAPVLDLMCTHFVLTLTQQQGAQFNLRRDLSGLLPLCGRHLVWPVTVLHRLHRQDGIP